MSLSSPFTHLPASGGAVGHCGCKSLWAQTGFKTLCADKAFINVTVCFGCRQLVPAQTLGQVC